MLHPAGEERTQWEDKIMQVMRKSSSTNRQVEWDIVRALQNPPSHSSMLTCIMLSAWTWGARLKPTLKCRGRGCASRYRRNVDAVARGPEQLAIFRLPTDQSIGFYVTRSAQTSNNNATHRPPSSRTVPCCMRPNSRVYFEGVPVELTSS